MLNKLKIFIFQSPFIKTFIFIASVLISGILCGAFVTEITVNGKLVWNKFVEARSFYFLIVFSIFVYLYNRFIFQTENKVKNFTDRNFCKAYIRSECLPEITKKYKELIKNGQKSEDLKEIQTDLEGLIK